MQASLRILIIDDDQEILDILLSKFADDGYLADSANSGYAAVKMLENNIYDIVISDYRMPNGNGMTVLNHVQLMINKPVFYFFSGQADMSVGDCLKEGAIQFFSKPLDFNLMLLEIKKLYCQKIK